ncbi:hypothetical protein [Klebsiella pneumoniae]|nr:hypothetical protein [Klebsiella pneumoniae]
MNQQQLKQPYRWRHYLHAHPESAFEAEYFTVYCRKARSYGH